MLKLLYFFSSILFIVASVDFISHKSDRKTPNSVKSLQKENSQTISGLKKLLKSLENRIER